MSNDPPDEILPMVRNVQPDPYANLDTSDWWHPAKLASDDKLHIEQPILTNEQVRQFREDGFLVVTGLWPDNLISRASTEAMELHPRDQIIERHNAGKQFRGFSEMPWVHKQESAPETALNHMTIHPRALRAVAQLMETDGLNIRLSQSHVIARFGELITESGDGLEETIKGDQDIHVDYGNNTLMVPPRTVSPECVACLCYYSDVDECGGATHFVKAEPDELTTYEPGAFNPPNFVIGTANGSAATETGPRSPERVAARYKNEKPVYYKPGTCILYGMNTWHRGTPVALNQVRHSHHHVWRHKNAEWVNWQSLAPRMAAMPPRFLAKLSVTQRTVLGFAAPGNSYWTEETLDAISQRYPGMDMGPYQLK